MEQIKELLEKEAETGDDRHMQRLINRLRYFRNNVKIFSAFIAKETIVSIDWIAKQRAEESFYELYHDQEHSHIYFTVKDKDGEDQLYRYSTMEVMGGHSTIRFMQIMVDYIRPTNGFSIDYRGLDVGEYCLPVQPLLMIGFDAFKYLFQYPLPPTWDRFILKPIPNTVGFYRYQVIPGNEEYSEGRARDTYFEFMKLFGGFD